jgi:hypothetical protein
MDELERAAEAVERARELPKSRQPRFATKAESFAGAVMRWVKSAKALEEPDYAANSMRRDTWLSDFWRLEPHLASVLNSVVMIDQNRGWTLTGGRNQVYRYTNVLHNYHLTPELAGWRPGLGGTALSFYTTDLGGIAEIWREGRGGPLRGLVHVDSTRCRLTGSIKTPLRYNPLSGRVQNWTMGDYFRVTSMPSIQEKYLGLGFCGVSRCLDLAKIMVAIYEHDQEMVGAKMPKGILLLQGIDEPAWDAALEARDAKLDSLERQYFGGVFTLLSPGIDQIDAKLVALSQLPANFDLETFTNLLMYGYAAAFGYDASEFWPVQYGGLGRGRETEVQHIKATAKGGIAFALTFQEQLQELLPDTLQFDFEQRDDEASLLEAQVAQAWADVAKTLAAADPVSNVSLLDREQALTMLVDAGVIPAEWTEFEEESQATDTEEARMSRLRQEALSWPTVSRAIAHFPTEPIIRYHWPSGRETVLWEWGLDALKRSVWRGAVLDQVRQDVAAGEVLYRAPDGDFEITQGDVDRAIEEAGRRVGPELEALLRAEAGTEEEK